VVSLFSPFHCEVATGPVKTRLVHNKNIISCHSVHLSGLFYEQTDHYYHYRYAALMALSCVGEGCHKQMEAVLPEIMVGVLGYLQDSVSTLIFCLVGTKTG
jgi:hypothetical protein